jgi:type VI secretion system secreted protein Hcp
MLRRSALTAATTAAALFLLPVLPGHGEALGQMTMTLESARGGEGVSAIIESYRHAIEIPLDELTARATGRRVHHPFRVTKRVDRSTPLLYRAMTASETIPSVRIRVPTSLGRGGDPVMINLSNARIVAIESSSQPDERVGYETISFVYERIQWASEDGTVAHTDSWADGRN